jgi:hypothetical protein
MIRAFSPAKHIGILQYHDRFSEDPFDGRIVFRIRPMAFFSFSKSKSGSTENNVMYVVDHIIIKLDVGNHVVFFHERFDVLQQRGKTEIIFVADADINTGPYYSLSRRLMNSTH